MLPVPHIRTVETPTRLRNTIRKVDDYTLWAFNPPPYLAGRSTPPAQPRGDETR
jgi:hypothetical protein